MSTILVPAGQCVTPASAVSPIAGSRLGPLRSRALLLDLSLVLLVALAFRAAFLFRAPVFLIGDSENYFLPGYQLARGLGFSLELRRTPLYPWLIAGVVSTIGEDLYALALVQHALGVATAVLSLLLGRLLFGRWLGLLGGLLVAASGSQLLSEHTVMAESLFTTLVVLAVVLGVAAIRRGAALFLLSGLVLGLASLTRPIGLALVPALPLVYALTRPGLRRWLALSLVYAVGVGCVLLPWSVRNALQHERFGVDGVPGQTLVGRTVRHDRFVFWDPTTMTPHPDPRRQRARELMQDASERGRFITPLRRRLRQELGLTELEANALMRDLAIEAILRQPGYYVQGTLRSLVALAGGWPERLREHWETRRDPDSREEWESHPEIRHLLGPPDAVQERQFARAEQVIALQSGRLGPLVALLALLGVLAPLLGRPRRWAVLLPAVWSLILLLVAVAVVGPVLRYRYPADPLLLVLASGGLFSLTSWLAWLRQRGYRGAGARP